MAQFSSLAKVHIGEFEFYCHRKMEYVLPIINPVNNPPYEFIVVENQ